jgi:hypothetical protein
MELLCWAVTPLAIEPLLSAGASVPQCTKRNVVPALAKFFKTSERVRSGLLQIARGGDTFTEAEVLAAYEKEGVAIPAAWFKPLLESGTWEAWPALNYLKRHGTHDDVNLVLPLIWNHDKHIARLAWEVAAELIVRPPAPKAPAAMPAGPAETPALGQSHSSSRTSSGPAARP